MILCDVDGVVADFARPFTTIINSRWPDVAIVSHKDVRSYDTMGLTEEQLNWGWQTIKRKLNWWMGLPPLTDRNTLTRLGNLSVIFVTSRGATLGHPVQRQTYNWLAAQGVREPLVKASKNKAEVALHFGATLAIEDNPKYIMDYANAGIDVIVMDYPYTQGVVHDRIVGRVKTVKEALAIIKGHQK